MDKYDEHIAILKTLDVDKIYKEWLKGHGIFTFASRTGKAVARSDERNIGCLSMIKGSSSYVAETTELTEAIRADPRIPVVKVESDVSKFTEDNYIAMAEWQRRLDIELERV